MDSVWAQKPRIEGLIYGQGSWRYFLGIEQTFGSEKNMLFSCPIRHTSIRNTVGYIKNMQSFIIASEELIEVIIILVLFRAIDMIIHHNAWASYFGPDVTQDKCYWWSGLAMV
jgi:hypothetical protein